MDGLVMGYARGRRLKNRFSGAMGMRLYGHIVMSFRLVLYLRTLHSHSRRPHDKSTQ